MSAADPIADLDAQALLADAAREAHAAMLESRERMRAAESAEDYERYDRAFHRECRNLRQSLALRDRLKREAQDRAEADREARRTVDNERGDVVRGLLVERVTRLAWSEGERQDWTDAVLCDMDRFIEELPDRLLLGLPLEELVVRVLAEAGAGRNPGAGTAERRRWAEGLVAAWRAPRPRPPDPDTS